MPLLSSIIFCLLVSAVGSFFCPNQMLLSGWVSLWAMATPRGIWGVAVFPAVRQYKEGTHSGLRHGGAYRTRTGENCLEGSCVTATPMLRISAGKHYKTGGLSVQLSCVADFRIATVFTLRRSRSFPAARKEIKEVYIPAHKTGGGRGRIRTCCRHLCWVPLILLSFPSIDTAPLCYHRSGYEIDRGERIRTSLQAEHTGSC